MNTEEDELEIRPNKFLTKTKIQKQIDKLLDEDAAQKQRTWSYYQKLKASDPDKYWKQTTQIQMHNDAIALQDGFIDGDF